MRTIVLDTGAFIGAERRNRTVAEYVAAATEAGSSIVLPTPVLCEVWRAKPRFGGAGLRRSADTVAVLDAQLASEIGTLLDATNSLQIVDAAVALVAIQHRPSVVLTSDPEDIKKLIQAAGATCGLHNKRADVRIVCI